MQDLNYIIGVFLAIGSGILNNLGTLVQKKVINDRPVGEKVTRNLLKSPLWLFGLFLQLALGTVLFMFAIGMIGAALVPGLMAAGLIFLAIGAVKLIGEKLNRAEIIGIIIMVVAIGLLGFSQLNLVITINNLLDSGFINRVIIFTVILIIGSFICEILQRKKMKFRALYLAIFSGFMFALSNFWVAPLVAVFSNIFNGSFQIVELTFFIISCIILCLTNFCGLLKIQQAFTSGQASNLIPIQQTPIQVVPIFIYFIVLVPIEIYSIPLMVGGVACILFSSYLLAKRQAQLEEIK